jgi:hypothetical protein
MAAAGKAIGDDYEQKASITRRQMAQIGKGVIETD